MSGLRLLPLIAVLAAAALARAEGEPLASRQAEVAALEGQRSELLARKAALESRSQAEGREIEQLKAAPPGIARDLRLGQLLASSRQRADQLSALSAELRGREARLAEARRALVAACRAALARGAVGEAEREAVGRLALATERALALAAVGGGVQVAPAGSIDLLEGPAELGERADRLRDDQDKLGREAGRLATRIARLEERRRLRERAADLDEDLFLEAGVARHVQRPAGTAALGAADKASTPAQAGAQPNFGGSPASASGGGGASPGGSTAPDGPAVTLRGVLDPATVDELRRAEVGQDPEAELSALRRARADLVARARELAEREAELRRRAQLLTGTK